jgi:hypothetical protein
MITGAGEHFTRKAMPLLFLGLAQLRFQRRRRFAIVWREFESLRDSPFRYRVSFGETAFSGTVTERSTGSTTLATGRVADTSEGLDAR